MPVIAFNAGHTLPDRVYVDSNVVIAFFYQTHSVHLPASAFVLESLRQRTTLVISHLTLDELWYFLMMQRHMDSVGTKFNVKSQSHVSPHTAEIDRVTNSLLALSNICLFSCDRTAEIVTYALGTLKAHNFAPRDAFHLANMTAAGIPAMATSDKDFDRLATNNPDLTIFRI